MDESIGKKAMFLLRLHPPVDDGATDGHLGWSLTWKTVLPLEVLRILAVQA
jgi:hypothetical protein